jgi:hypothetical protein
MAHHQGMTLLAIANAPFDNRLQQYFHAEPHVMATELLLHERMPATVMEEKEEPLPVRKSGTDGPFSDSQRQTENHLLPRFCAVHERAPPLICTNPGQTDISQISSTENREISVCPGFARNRSSGGRNPAAGDYFIFSSFSTLPSRT